MASFDPRDALVINEHNGDGVPDDTESGRISNRFMVLVEACHAVGIKYELSEERSVEEDGVIEDGRLVLGQRSYGRVLPDGCVFHSGSEGRTAPERLRAAGVTVWAAGEAEADAWLGSSECRPLAHSATAVRGEAFVPRQNAGESGYSPKSDRQVKTRGPFQLSVVHEQDASDLIASGWPYYGGMIKLQKRLELDEDTGPVILKLSGIAGDAARLDIDNATLGWIRGPEWEAELPDGFAVGIRELAVRIVPSTYNVFGPHRHIDGDRHLTSPNQYSGVRNFADNPGAPASTKSEDYHFVRWGFAGEVLLLKQLEAPQD
ncbi:hypothetical protein ACFSR7_02230 [Cohnella sp. GCM10020058]|uniref:hypothetical protein n=1 Tax=Cohnella sp. GCM10020058 TaxID=3317330 RepID=UPI00363CCD8C